MKRSKHKPEQIILKLRTAEKMAAEGRTVSDIVRELGVSISSAADLSSLCEI